ncbi:MAG: hypothetical protein U0798_15200 [Gemmataceae bacterium]
MRHRDNPAIYRADGTLTKYGVDYLRKQATSAYVIEKFSANG